MLGHHEDDCRHVSITISLDAPLLAVLQQLAAGRPLSVPDQRALDGLSASITGLKKKVSLISTAIPKGETP